jgi:peptidoglycan/xylan/chitin deacetylase (PgdA/CDA1 family)
MDKSTFQSTQVFILSYHSFAHDNWAYTTPKKEFIKQIKFLKKNKYSFISLQDLEKSIKNKEIPKKSVVVTIDDGYKDTLEVADFLKKESIPTTLFVLSNRKNINRKEVATQKELITKNEIVSLIKKGWTIGSHSATHANLKTLSQKELHEEIINSKEMLENEFSIPISYFAFPRGQYSADVLKVIKKAGYSAAVTMDDGFISVSSNLLTLPRVGVNRTHTISEFKTLFSPSVIRFRMLIKKITN